MDLMSGLQALFGSDATGARQKSEQKNETFRRQESQWQKQQMLLKEQLDTARNRIVQLENQIRKMTESATEETVTEETREAGMEQINELLLGIQEQVQEMKEMLSGMEAQALSMEAINEKAESLRADIVEKVHTENVQCYRNMKGLVTDLEVKISELELDEKSLKKIRKSFKGMKFFSFFGFLTFIAAILWWLFYGYGFIYLEALFNGTLHEFV